MEVVVMVTMLGTRNLVEASSAHDFMINIHFSKQRYTGIVESASGIDWSLRCSLFHLCDLPKSGFLSTIVLAPSCRSFIVEPSQRLANP